jgi:hypothetical protein
MRELKDTVLTVSAPKRLLEAVDRAASAELRQPFRACSAVDPA